MRRGQIRGHGVQSLPGASILHPQPRHHADALGLDEDPALVILARPEGAAEAVVGPAKPLAIPARRPDRRLHVPGGIGAPPGQLRLVRTRGHGPQLIGRQHEQPGDEHAFGDAPVPIRRRLEGFARRVREGVQVQAVVPVGAADQRQTMRTQAVEGVLNRSPQMVEQRLGGSRLAVVLRRLVQHRPVAGLLQVGRHRQHQPQRVVVEAAADGVVAAPGQRLVLMIGAAVGQLRPGQIEEALARSIRSELRETQQVLIRVPEPYASPDARLEEGGRTRQVEGGHHLVRVPHVDHAVRVRIGRGGLEAVQPRGPVVAQLLEGHRHLIRPSKPLDRGRDAALVQHLKRLIGELLIIRVLVIAEQHNQRPGLLRLQLDRHLQRADRLPAVGDRIRELAVLEGGGGVPAAVWPQEGLALGVESHHRFGGGQVGEVIAALAILGLVVDHPVDDLDLAERVIALEVGGVVPGIPQAKLHAGDHREAGGHRPLVGQRQAPDFQACAEGDEGADRGGDAGGGGGDGGVAQPVPALVARQRATHGQPGRRPHLRAGARIAQVDQAPAPVGRHVVVAKAGQASQPGVFVEGVAAAGLRDDAEVVLAADVVDPRQWRVRPVEDILACLVVEVPISHGASIRIPIP